MYQLENGWVQSVKQVPSPNYDLRPENIEISLLVIHGISLPPGIFDNEFVEEFFTNQLDHTKDPYFEQLINLKVSSHLYKEIGRNYSIRFIGSQSLACWAVRI